MELAQMMKQAQTDKVGWLAQATIGSASDAPHGGRMHGQGERNTSARLAQEGGQVKAQELGTAELRELMRQMQGALEQTKVMHQVQAKVQAQLREMASAVIYGRHWKKGKQTRHERQMTTRQWTQVAKTRNEED